MEVAEHLDVLYKIDMKSDPITGGVPHLEEVLERLVSEFKPLKVVLFGSWARGDQSPRSDIDLLVVAETTGPMNERMARAQRALRASRPRWTCSCARRRRSRRSHGGSRTRSRSP